MFIGLIQTVVALYESPSLSTLLLLELVIFAVCLHWWLPQRHRQTRTVKLPAPTDKVWKTILDIENYPSWRSHVIEIRSVSTAQHSVSFLEHVARTRQHLAHKQQSSPTSSPLYNTRVRLVEMVRVDEQRLLRRDQARRQHSTAADSPKLSKAVAREWELYLRPSATEDSTLLTLTETVCSEGLLARWLGPILGFHRASQRFMYDLSREIERQRDTSCPQA
ncbi:hypothetical protein DFQ28_007951 [Apophysomyces sp. BC1034]|nr:hypothetical protein DFQ30_007726 [Apophysomyces sp. BC1015]KAG0175929.1 hypothetical protein DFQ29_006793 [Apophysomyces sp. BC1021]KAG0186373.1 hypothetical protein DFQ28_007951 [Apophysomyces sp. BC1034]